MEFKKHKLTNIIGSYKENGVTTNITGDIYTSAISVDADTNTITMNEIGSVYSFKVYGQTSSIDDYYSSISFSQNGDNPSHFGIGPGAYSTSGWYGSSALVIGYNDQGGGFITVNASTIDLPVLDGTIIYFTPVFTKDTDGYSYFGVLWSDTPYFEKSEHYMKLVYGGGTVSHSYNSAVGAFFDGFEGVEVVGTTDTSKFNLKSWLFGFVLGLAGRPLPILTQPTSTEEVTE